MIDHIYFKSWIYWKTDGRIHQEIKKKSKTVVINVTKNKILINVAINLSKVLKLRKIKTNFTKKNWKYQEMYWQIYQKYKI